MIFGYVYKLQPNPKQSQKMAEWLKMLRAHYNWCLADRINNYYQQFIQGEYSDLRTKAVIYPLTCCIVKGGATGTPYTKEGNRRNAGKIQDAELPTLKKARPWYKSIESTVLQSNIARLDIAYKNFFEGRGFPQFKNRSNFKSFEYKPGRVSVDFAKSKVNLPSIGKIKFFNSRTIPAGFQVKSVTIRQKQNGWYMSVRIEDKSIPDFPSLQITAVNTAIGLDMGITKLVHCSDGQQFNNPKFATNKKTRRTLISKQ